MIKPDFKKMYDMIDHLVYVKSRLAEMAESEEHLKPLVETACQGVLFSSALDSMASIPVEELGNSKAGIRVSAIKDAGYSNLKEIALASDSELTRIEGVGIKQVESIRNISMEFQNQLVEYAKIKISPDSMSPEEETLVKALYQYRGVSNIVNNHPVPEAYNYFKDVLDDINSRKIAMSGLRWFFSTAKTKELTIAADRFLSKTVIGPECKEAQAMIDAYDIVMTSDTIDAMTDFITNSADYYALLDYFGGERLPKPLIYSSVPAKLAANIDKIELNLSGFKGNLRSYQTFGAKYILHQERALLGDEMGLGKTVEAIAVMAHIYAEMGGGHFLVVCPASVLVNWAREIAKFSNIPVQIVHGHDRDEEVIKWQKQGGVCVTNYETMGKIVGSIDNQMVLELMVIDEAHYIKNPDAKRTKYIHALDNESKRILLMTGTPLENKVEEMCSLIDFIRPDMADTVRGAARMTKVPEFREMVAPVYLRRLRTDVLDELPPIEHKEEWCEMSPTDLGEYIYFVTNRNFNDLRRVGFTQADMNSSAKAVRIKELCDDAKREGRKVIIYSFYRETIDKVSEMLGEACIGEITGSTEPARRQEIIDEFSASDDKHVLVAQIQAGGTGLNIQAASVVIFCEPQIKPSLENQALSRVYRMGQNRNVLVYHILCPETVDEAVTSILSRKQEQFNLYANESVMAGASDAIIDNAWIQDYLDKASRKYLEHQ